MFYLFCVIKFRCADVGVVSFKEIKTLLTGVFFSTISFIGTFFKYESVVCTL